MRAILATVLALVAASAGPAVAQQATPFPGFSCVTLAHRQKLAGAPGVTFKVLKQTYAKDSVPLPHRHKFGEIVYLLSGNGTNTMNGKTVALTADKAVVVPAEMEHTVVPTGDATLTVLSVQFTDKVAPGWHAANYKGPTACKD